jgi:iron transport multicopper oxidase
MLKVVHLLCVSALLLLRTSNAAIGPVADLTIRNRDISPDGFLRSYVFTFCLFRTWSLISFSAVLAGGTFPGPVIRGVKGDRFKLNVIDRLKDARMLRSTSIVHCIAYRFPDKCLF